MKNPWKRPTNSQQSPNINKWARQWKMSVNPDPTKMAQEVLFSRKKV